MEINKRTSLALPLLTVSALAIAAVLWATGLFGTSTSVGPEQASAGDLEPFGSCDELVDYVRENRWALEPIPYPMAIEDGAVSGDAALATRSADTTLTASPDSVGPGETGTNVQEIGIDEPDIAKLDGETLYVVERGELRSFEVGGEDPVALDTVAFPSRTSEPQLLIAGDRALVIGESYGRQGGEPITNLTEIDITDPAALATVSELELEGDQVSARLRGETAHLVLASSPDYRGIMGRGDEPVGDDPVWLPQASLSDLATGETTTEPLFGCDAVSYPQRFAGVDLLSVLTLDLTQRLAMSDVDTVITDGSTVYASPSSLYVATAAMAPPDEGPGILRRMATAIAPDMTSVVSPEALPVPSFPDETTIHRFDTTDPAATSYSSSGRVDGRILNEWSFSEHDGNLRVATTEGDSWSGGPNESESAITVLAERDGVLEQVGRVGGLGRGEEIFGVRFIEDTGYVVTFEQTDPLYAVDLSNPEAPVMTGELKIPGYSAYLHPVGEGRLLGIGQGGTQTGMLTGAQASLFDVADAESPARLATLDLAGGGYGTAATESDHHAFMFSPERSLAVVPVESYSRNGRDAFRGAVAMRVDAEGGLTEIGRFEDAGGRIERIFVVGERLVTLSSGRVQSRDLEAQI